MPQLNIDATLSPEDQKAIKAHVEAIEQKLTFLVNLTPKERKALFKAGPDSVSFLQNALDAARDHPNILPSNFDVPAFQRDVELFSAMTDINTVIATLAAGVDDTRMAVGSEAMQEAIQIYTFVKAAAKTTPGLKAVAEQLGERFRRAKRKKSPEPAAE